MPVLVCRGWKKTQPRERLVNEKSSRSVVRRNRSYNNTKSKRDPRSRKNTVISNSATTKHDGAALLKFQNFRNRKNNNNSSVLSGSWRNMMGNLTATQRALILGEKTPSKKKLENRHNTSNKATSPHDPFDEIQWNHLLVALLILATAILFMAINRQISSLIVQSELKNKLAAISKEDIPLVQSFSVPVLFLWSLLRKMLFMEIRRRLWRIAINSVRYILKVTSVIRQTPRFDPLQIVPTWITRGLTKLFLKKVKKNVNSYLNDALEDGIAAGEICSVFFTVQQAWSQSLAQEYFLVKTLRVLRQLVRRLVIIEFRRLVWQSLFKRMKKGLIFIFQHEYFFLPRPHIPQWIKRGLKKIFKKNVNSVVKDCWLYAKQEMMGLLNVCMCSSLSEDSTEELTCSLSFSFGFCLTEWDFGSFLQMIGQGKMMK